MNDSIKNSLAIIKLYEQPISEAEPIANKTVNTLNTLSDIQTTGGATSWLASILPAKWFPKISSLGKTAFAWFEKLFSFVKVGQLGLEAKEKFEKAKSMEEYMEAVFIGLNAIGYATPYIGLSFAIDSLYHDRVAIMNLIQSAIRPSTIKGFTKEEVDILENAISELEEFEEIPEVKTLLYGLKKLFTMD